jgi:16S rRNA (guanine527-N7)-methyltransferase
LQLQEGRHAIYLMGGHIGLIHDMSSYTQQQHRWIAVIEKRGVTPFKYPRKPGLVSKRPLLPPE